MAQLDQMGPSIGAQLLAMGELAMQRHATQQTAQPKRAAASYLRVALTCARELSRHAKLHPELRADALRLVERVITTARAAEEACFTAGGNSAAYISLLVAAEGLRITLADIPVESHEASRRPAAIGANGPRPPHRLHPSGGATMQISSVAT